MDGVRRGICSPGDHRDPSTAAPLIQAAAPPHPSDRVSAAPSIGGGRGFLYPSKGGFLLHSPPPLPAAHGHEPQCQLLRGHSKRADWPLFCPELSPDQDGAWLD